MKQLHISAEIYFRLKTQSKFTLQAIIVPSCMRYKRAIATPIQVNILVPISQTRLESLISYTDNRNILVSFIDRSLASDSLVFIFEEKCVAILDKKLTSKSVDNNTVFYGMITNKATAVWSHIAAFEKKASREGS